MKCNYIVGSDAKTVKIAKQINRVINSALERGDFTEADRLVGVALGTMNIPLRMEILHQIETQDVFAS